MIAFASFSQGSSDTIVINRVKFVNALQAGIDGKAYKEQRDLLLTEVDTLKARIAIKEMIIINLNGKISDYKSIVSSKDAIIATQGEQRKIWEDQIASLNKELKKQRRQKRMTAFLGLLTTGIAGYLYFTK